VWGGGKQGNLGFSFEDGDSTHPGIALPPGWM
jgi:hypothetical protein